MTLHDLVEQLAPQFPASVQKDLKTAVRVLAQALTYTDAKSCPLESCLRPLPDLYQIIETFLTAQGKSSHTIRNTKNNLSRLFRSAETQRLWTLLPDTPARRFKAGDAPRRFKQPSIGAPDGSHLRRSAWPADVEHEFSRFCQWASDPMVEGRPAAWKKCATTLKIYEGLFSTYFGYLHHTLHIDPIRFDHLFDVGLIEQFITWHINEKWHRTTHAALHLVTSIQAMASQYRPDPTVVAAMKVLRKRMPPLRPVYNKSDVWISLHELERVGIAIWPTRPLQAVHRPDRPRSGAILATRASLSLMLRLWVHIPYRQRNMREMKLDQNLYRTHEGQWRIRFAGEQLKVATKRGQPNVFDLPFPPSLVPTLESYLTTWRPLLVQTTHALEVFLNRDGYGFKRPERLREAFRRQVYSVTGRLWHPHMIRTIWATEWIRSGGDFMTAAIMLNDRLETVIKNYSHLRDENVAEHAYQWVQKRLKGH